MNNNSVPPLVIVPPQNESLSYKNNNSKTIINDKNNNMSQPLLIQLPSQSQSKVTLNKILDKHHSINKSLGIFNDPIFYSVFLGCVSFIYYFYSQGQQELLGFCTSTCLFGYIVSLLGSAFAPLIISDIKPSKSIIIGTIVVFINYILFTDILSWFKVAISGSLRGISFQLVSISIYYWLSTVNFESKYKHILFGLYFFVQYGLSGLAQYESLRKLAIPQVYIPLFVLAVIFVTLLPNSSNTSDSTSSSDSISLVDYTQQQSTKKPITDIIANPKVFKNEKSSSNLLYMAPVLFIIGICDVVFLPFFNFAAALSIIPIALLTHRFGKVVAFKWLVVFGSVAITLGFAVFYKNNLNKFDMDDQSIYASVLYSIFSSGTKFIVYSMMDELFPKDRLLSGISTIGAFFIIGNIMGAIFSIGYVIFEIGWFIVIVSFAPSCIYYISYLSSNSN